VVTKLDSQVNGLDYNPPIILDVGALVPLIYIWTFSTHRRNGMSQPGILNWGIMSSGIYDIFPGLMVYNACLVHNMSIDVTRFRCVNRLANSERATMRPDPRSHQTVGGDLLFV
jgi:hypothetical protein